jgi:hypothetical protein
MRIKHILTFLAFLVNVLIFAQSEQKHSLDIGTQGGYEFNYFKSPTEVVQDGVLFTSDSLISSSGYQDIKADYDYRIKWGANRLRISVAPSIRYFYDATDDSYWSLTTHAKYDRKVSRTTKILAELSLKRMNREGLDGAQDVLINPLGYTNYGAAMGIQFALIKDNKSTAEAFYNFKNFDAFGVQNLQFNEFGIQLKSVKSYYIGKQKHRYGATLFAKKRLYQTFNASNIDTEGERDWDYVKGTVFYDLPISKTFEIKPSLVYYQRIDNLLDRSGFTQFGPALGVKYKNKKTTLSGKISYLTRNYKTLLARDNSGLTGENIQYTYADFSLNASQRLRKNIYLTATAYSRVRTTNFTDIDARSFRGYRNQYMGMGLRWEF